MVHTLYTAAIVLGIGYSQTGVIRGIVRDVETGAPLIGVQLYLEANPSRQALTGANGRFELDNIPAGRVVIVIRRMEYRAQFDTVQLASAESIQRAYALESTWLSWPQWERIAGDTLRCGVPDSLALAKWLEGLGQTERRLLGIDTQPVVFDNRLSDECASAMRIAVDEEGMGVEAARWLRGKGSRIDWRQLRWGVWAAHTGRIVQFRRPSRDREEGWEILHVVLSSPTARNVIRVDTLQRMARPDR